MKEQCNLSSLSDDSEFKPEEREASYTAYCAIVKLYLIRRKYWSIERELESNDPENLKNGKRSSEDPGKLPKTANYKTLNNSIG